MTKKLSKRELEVAKLLEKGYKNKKIAEIIKVDEKAVSSYIARIVVKIGLGQVDTLERNTYVIVTQLQIMKYV